MIRFKSWWLGPPKNFTRSQEGFGSAGAGVAAGSVETIRNGEFGADMAKKSFYSLACRPTNDPPFQVQPEHCREAGKNEATENA
ncbi:MAG TPA: hypothetical protein VNJ12_10885 [Candidatus Dormibacteraeota bacterium]|nr:hypothetical protein [Candidatus Dormibacteraeota bacterium]